MANSNNKSKTNSNSVPSAKYGLGLIAGILYLAFGIMQLTATVGFTMPFYESLYISGGIFNAFVLLVTAAVFIVKRSEAEKEQN